MNATLLYESMFIVMNHKQSVFAKQLNMQNVQLLRIVQTTYKDTWL